MTPQEKAKELLDKMTTNTNNETLMYKNKYAKECALIAAIETKFAFMQIADYEKAAYWRAVELELEKL
jgi:hypothetical protein